MICMKKVAKGFLIVIGIIELLICIVFISDRIYMTGIAGIILVPVSIYLIIKESDSIDYKRIYLHLSADFLAAVVLIILMAVTLFYPLIIFPPLILLIATTIDAFRHCRNRKSALVSLFINPNLYYVLLWTETYIIMFFKLT